MLYIGLQVSDISLPKIRSISHQINVYSESLISWLLFHITCFRRMDQCGSRLTFGRGSWNSLGFLQCCNKEKPLTVTPALGLAAYFKSWMLDYSGCCRRPSQCSTWGMFGWLQPHRGMCGDSALRLECWGTALRSGASLSMSMHCLLTSLLMSFSTQIAELPTPSPLLLICWLHAFHWCASPNRRGTFQL